MMVSGEALSAAEIESLARGLIAILPAPDLPADWAIRFEALKAGGAALGIVPVAQLLLLRRWHTCSAERACQCSRRAASCHIAGIRLSYLFQPCQAAMGSSGISCAGLCRAAVCFALEVVSKTRALSSRICLVNSSPSSAPIRAPFSPHRGEIAGEVLRNCRIAEEIGRLRVGHQAASQDRLCYTKVLRC